MQVVKKIGGFRRKTRKKLSKHIREKGKISISKYFQSFRIGERVVLSADPAIQKGIYNPVFHGKSGIISAKTGNCYSVLIQDKNKQKMLVVHPVHLKRA